MVCAICQQVLPDDATFCLRCGAPQRADASDSAIERWETAKVTWGLSMIGWISDKYLLYVETASPDGPGQIFPRDRGGYWIDKHRGLPPTAQRGPTSTSWSTSAE